MPKASYYNDYMEQLSYLLALYWHDSCHTTQDDNMEFELRFSFVVFLYMLNTL